MIYSFVKYSSPGDGSVQFDTLAVFNPGHAVRVRRIVVNALFRTEISFLPYLLPVNLMVEISAVSLADMPVRAFNQPGVQEFSQDRITLMAHAGSGGINVDLDFVLRPNEQVTISYTLSPEGTVSSTNYLTVAGVLQVE